MVKVTGPCFSLSAAKSLKKTLTFQKRPSGHAVYPHSKPGDREPHTRSPKQAAQRTKIGNLVIQWQALTSSQKKSWDKMAEEAGYIGTGYHYFIHKKGVSYPGYLLLETDGYLIFETGGKIVL